MQSDLGIETNLISALSGEGLGADPQLLRSLITGRSGEDLVARSIPVELTRSAQVADGASELSLLYAQAEVTTIHRLFLKQEAWLDALETLTFQEHDAVLVHLHILIPDIHHIAGALDREIDILDLEGRHPYTTSGLHLLIVHREGIRIELSPRTAQHLALNIHQKGTTK